MIPQLAPGTVVNSIVMVLGAAVGALMVVLYPEWWPTRAFTALSFGIIAWALWRRFFKPKRVD